MLNSCQVVFHMWNKGLMKSQTYPCFYAFQAITFRTGIFCNSSQLIPACNFCSAVCYIWWRTFSFCKRINWSHGKFIIEILEILFDVLTHFCLSMGVNEIAILTQCFISKLSSHFYSSNCQRSNFCANIWLWYSGNATYLMYLEFIEYSNFAFELSALFTRGSNSNY